MNKTQKSAVFYLVIFLLWAVIVTYAFLTMFVITPKVNPTWTLLVPSGVIFVAFLFWLRKKQSPAEVESDERDNLIKKRAVITCFVSACILLVVGSVTPAVILGEYSSVPVILLPAINMSILMIAMPIYSIAVLIQYGWPGKGEKS